MSALRGSCFKDDKLDMDLVDAILYTYSYYKVNTKIVSTLKEGLKIKSRYLLNYK